MVAAPAFAAPTPVARMVDVAARQETETDTYEVGVTVALTTAWTAPASCATNIPTITAGDCDTASCSAFAATDIPDMLDEYGASVNFPGFTTSQQQTSTACMPPGYENVQSMYFVGKTASFCTSGWTTATIDTYASPTETVVCCPTNYPTPTSVDGNGRYDCYTMRSVTAGEQFVLAAQGWIETDRPNNWPTNKAFMASWVSESIVGTTTWSGPATTALVAHPGVNWLVVGDVKGGHVTGTVTGFGGGAAGVSVTGSVPTATDGSHSSTTEGFELFHLSRAASIGVLVAIAGGGLALFVALVVCCWCCFFRKRSGRNRKNKPAVAYNPVPAPAEPFPGEQQYGVKPGGQYGYPQQTTTEYYGQTGYGQGGYPQQPYGQTNNYG